MTEAAFAEHSVVRTRVPLVDKDRTVPAGVEGAIVYVYRVAPGLEPAYTVEIVICDQQGVQVDAWLLEAKHSELVPLSDPRFVTVRVVRVVESCRCQACGQQFEVVFERAALSGLSAVSGSIACPRCGDLSDDLALGALTVPVVQAATGRRTSG
jgi:hypothetical protein